jgi:hypothetical protein
MVTAFDAELIARSCEAVQRSCELLRSTQHLTSHLGERHGDPLPMDHIDDEPER